MQVVVTIGVGIASYGEINFVLIGVILQLISVATESTRLTLVQILLQVGAISNAAHRCRVSTVNCPFHCQAYVRHVETYRPACACPMNSKKPLPFLKHSHPETAAQCCEGYSSYSDGR